MKKGQIMRCSAHPYPVSNTFVTLCYFFIYVFEKTCVDIILIYRYNLYIDNLLFLNKCCILKHSFYSVNVIFNKQ